MVELHDEVIAKANDRGEMMSAADFLRFIEEYHHEGGPGVPRELVEAYAERLADQERASFDADALVGSVDERLTDDETWTKDALYAVGADRISTCPLRWHEELQGTTDLSEFVAVMQKGVDMPDRAPGVRREQVLDAATVIAGIDRETARERLQAQRRDGNVASKAGQSRNANVYVPDEEGWESAETKEDVAEQNEGAGAAGSDGREGADVETDDERDAETAADEAVSEAAASGNEAGSNAEASTGRDETSDIEDEPATMPDEEEEPATTPRVDDDDGEPSSDSTGDDERDA
ncbi:hypothetical protein [Halomicrococcus sp. SG-WS-1]|uniref:hypothetical protein n=1 Tax=Halomicrococcus sp. SG-WS-1 TaxID=3439057 RepID=UPI003F7ABFD4